MKFFQERRDPFHLKQRSNRWLCENSENSENKSIGEIRFSSKTEKPEKSRSRSFDGAENFMEVVRISSFGDI